MSTDPLGPDPASAESKGPGSLASAVVLTLLGVDGVISAILGVALLNLRFGTVLVPLGLVLSAALNLVLVWCALVWAPAHRGVSVPVWAYIATLTVLMFGGPGGDILFTGLGPLWLFLAGVLPAAFVLRRGSFGRPVPGKRSDAASRETPIRARGL